MSWTRRRRICRSGPAGAAWARASEECGEPLCIDPHLRAATSHTRSVCPRVWRASSGPNKVRRLNALVSGDPQVPFLVGLQLVALKVLGQPLADAIHLMEGEGFIAPMARSHIAALQEFMRAIEAPLNERQDPRYVALQVFADSHKRTLPQQRVNELVYETWSHRREMLHHWKERVWDALSQEIGVFEGFTVLDPVQVVGLENAMIVKRLRMLTASETAAAGKNPRTVKGVKGVTERLVISAIAELVTYKQLASQQAHILSQCKVADRPDVLWTWWGTISATVPSLAEIARKAALHDLPSSASIERFFSILKNATTKDSSAECADTLELRGILLYNDRRKGAAGAEAGEKD